MNDVSEEQQSLLERIQSGRYPRRTVARQLLTFISDKPEGELLDPAWIDVWHTFEPFAADYLSPRACERISEAMRAVRRVDEGVWDLRVSSKTVVTFLLGAGASAPSGIPTVDKLLEELWERARKIGREDLDRLATWCREQRITNIEDLLTAAYLSDFAAKKPNITSLLDYFLFAGARERSEREEYLSSRRRSIRPSGVDVSSVSFLQDTLQTLFGLLTSTMISASPNAIHHAIVDFVAKHPKASIITTNYDGCMDEAILRTRLSRKDTAGAEQAANCPQSIEPIKMHGSINWAYCDSCQDVREFDLLELKETYEEDRLSYPVLGICKNCGGLRRPLLVPPLSLKFLTFPNLIDIWNSARQCIEGADYLVVVGYSFSEADTYLTNIILRSMSMKERQRMLVVNTDSSLVPTLRERFSVHIDGFEQARILRACQKAEEILPEILDGMLVGKAGTKKAASKKKKKVARS